MAAVPKKILLAVDGSVHSRSMLDYVAHILPHLPALTCCLLHVQSGLSPMLVEEAERDPKTKAQLEAVVRRNEAHGRRVLDHSREVLQRHGLAFEAIETTTQPRIIGLARDIIMRAEAAPYDAIVVGRRGVSGLQKLFMGSLTAKLCEHSEIVPVWVVDGDRPQDGFLLAVDGSQNAMRALDHMAFMLTGSRTAHVTLVHVASRPVDHSEIDLNNDEEALETVLTLTGQQVLDRFVAATKSRLVQAGLDPDRIEFRQVKRNAGTGRAILDLARRRGLGTVVIGRRGSGGAFYSGRVCRYVMEKSARRTFWLVP